MKHKILDHKWDLVYVPNISAHGECDGPHVKGKQIRIRSNLSKMQKIETVIHECLHAAAYDVLSEYWVTHTARDITTVLRKEGLLS